MSVIINGTAALASLHLNTVAGDWDSFHHILCGGTSCCRPDLPTQLLFLAVLPLLVEAGLVHTMALADYTIVENQDLTLLNLALVLILMSDSGFGSDLNPTLYMEPTNAGGSNGTISSPPVVVTAGATSFVSVPRLPIRCGCCDRPYCACNRNKCSGVTMVRSGRLIGGLSTRFKLPAELCDLMQLRNRNSSWVPRRRDGSEISDVQ